ncbi:NUDIX domain-containing protein, partial [Thiolapillus sp.]
MSTEYVVGFLFSEDLEWVALIRKARPEWQAGLLNGIGGHIENTDESPLHAMRREFKEEAGVYVEDWQHYARLSENGQFTVDFFYASGDLGELRTTTDESIVVIGVNTLDTYKIVENVSWLVPLAVDCLVDGRPGFAEITYPSKNNVLPNPVSSDLTEKIGEVLNNVASSSAASHGER